MRLYIGIYFTSVLLSACISGPAINEGKVQQTTNSKPNKTQTVSALILTDSVKNSNELKEQLSFLYNGLPKKYVVNTKKFEDANLDARTDLTKMVANDLVSGEAIRRICFPVSSKPDKTSRFIVSILTFLAPKLIGLFVKEVDKRLEKEIAKYSKTHKKSVSIRPYKDSNNFELKSPCFRYTRFKEKQYNLPVQNNIRKVQSERELEFDFIGQWRVLEGQHIRIRPLRIYMETPIVPKDSKKVSLAISAKVNAVWRNDNVGRSEEVFNTIVLRDKFKNPTNKTTSWSQGLKFYNLTEQRMKSSLVGQDETQSNTKGILTDNKGIPLKFIRKELNSYKSWADFTALPIIPYSKNSDPETAIANLEISVAEVGSGAKKSVLKLAQQGLSLFEDDVTTVLEEAAVGFLETDVPAVNTPEKYCATFTSILSDDGVLEGSAEWTGGNETCDEE